MTLTKTLTKQQQQPPTSLHLANTTQDPPTSTQPPPPNPQHHCPLFLLPHELRLQIYTLALQKPVSPLLAPTHHNPHDAEPSFLTTCRLIRREALPLFYSANDWIVKTRRVNGYLDVASKRLVTYDCIPRWPDNLPDEKIGWIRRVVVVGSRGSYVDVKGKWRDGDRAAFRLERGGRGGRGWGVEEVDGEMDEAEGQDRDGGKDAFCRILLVDLLKARMRCNGQTAGRNWVWTRDRIHELAFLL